eukprot:1158447-Pelagomonas_calceolata.AAC.3
MAALGQYLRKFLLFKLKYHMCDQCAWPANPLQQAASSMAQTCFYSPRTRSFPENVSCSEPLCSPPAGETDFCSQGIAQVRHLKPCIHQGWHMMYFLACHRVSITLQGRHLLRMSSVREIEQETNRKHAMMEASTKKGNTL